MKNNFIKYIILILTLLLTNFIFISSVYADDTVKAPADNNGGASVVGSTVLDKNFDVRTKSTVTAESINANFAGGVYEGKGAFIIELADKKGINAGFMASIIAQETGWGKSGNLVKQHFNPGGLTCGGNKPGSNDEGVSWGCVYIKDRYYKKFSSAEDGLVEKANYLKRKYIDQGVYTIDKIQKIYCPDGDGSCSTTWTSGILRHMGKLGEQGGLGVLEGSGGGQISTPEQLAAEGIYEHVSIFAEYEIEISDIGNVGVNEKKDFDNKLKEYKLGKFIKGVLAFTHTITLGLSILFFGYVSLIWLLVLLARTRIEVLHNWILKITANKIDAYDSIGYLCKVSVVTTFFVVICASGLMSYLFAFIYSLIMWIFSYVLY